jgi:large subunit ribosomal protein L37e
MVKGTPSMGLKHKITHIRCRRCGNVSYRVDKKYCSYCGYGRSSKLRKYSWQNKTRTGKRKK